MIIKIIIIIITGSLENKSLARRGKAGRTISKFGALQQQQ